MARGDALNFFAHSLLSWNQLSAPGLGSDNGIGAILGGGIDLKLFRLLSIRMVEADYVWARHHYDDAASPSFPDLRRPSLDGLRIGGGLLWNFGYPPSAIPAASCSVQPSEVMVGEPVTATATGANFNSKHTLNYTWSSTGGKITGTGNTASIDTNGIAGGTYTATARISDPKTKGGEATCTANFTVKEPPKNPPTMSCSANPATLEVGGTTTVTCNCTSPDNASVTVGGWTASGGSVSSSGGNAAALNTSGASAGPIMVSASCTDSRGLSTPATAQVMVENPPPPSPSPEFIQLEARLALHSIYFATDQPRVANPNGGLLASQEQTLVSLADDFKKYLETKPDAHLILGGHADPRASVAYNQALSERRVERTKRFLIEHGVPEANIETKAFGEERNLTADQVKDAVEKNPELTPEQRQRVLDNLQTILLASNRRVDVTLSTTGQKSIREYPFNAADSLTLLQQKGAKKTAGPATRRRAKPKVPQ